MFLVGSSSLFANVPKVGDLIRFTPLRNKILTNLAILSVNWNSIENLEEHLGIKKVRTLKTRRWTTCNDKDEQLVNVEEKWCPCVCCMCVWRSGWYMMIPSTAPPPPSSHTHAVKILQGQHRKPANNSLLSLSLPTMWRHGRLAIWRWICQTFSQKYPAAGILAVGELCTSSSSVSDPYSWNPDPDPAKNLNPDPEDPWIRIQAIS